MGLGADDASVVRPWGLIDATAAMVAGVVGNALVVGVLHPSAHPSIGALFLLNTPFWAFWLGVPLWVTAQRGRGPRLDLGLAVAPVDVAALAVGALTQVLVGWAYAPFVSGRRVEEPARALARAAHGTSGTTILVAMTLVVAPVIEELFYRGLIMRALMRGVPTWMAVGIAALIFGILHFEPLQLPGLVCFGCVAGALAVRTGRLGTAMLAHLGFNAVAIWQLHVF